MIHGLLFILKILMWIILGILGLILGILLFVLFCAVRYQADACRRYGEVTARIQVRCFWFARLNFGYEEGKAKTVLRIFGIPVWRSDPARVKSGHEADPMTEQDRVSGQEPKAQNQSGQMTESRDKTRAAGQKTELPQKARTSGHIEESRQSEPSGETNAFSRRESFSEEKSFSQADSFSRDETSSQDKAPAQSRIHRLADGLKSRLSSLREKVRFAFRSFCDKIKQAQDRFQWLLEKWEELREILEDPANQKSARLLTRQIKKILQHILPRKGQGEVTFGLEDPYWMGKLLSLAAVLYPFTRDRIIFHPVFDESILEGELHVRGKVRAGVLLFFVLRLLLDANIRSWAGRLMRYRR